MTQLSDGAGDHLGHVQDRGEVEAGGLPVLDGGVGVERLRLPDGLGEAAEAELGQQLADLLGDVLEEGDDELGLAAEALAQLGVLGGHADGAGVEMADPHHHAAAHDERCGGEAELLGAEQGGDHHVPPRLELAVDLHDDAVAQAVQHQGLLGLGQAELPGRPGVLERGERRGAGAAVVAGDEHHVGVGLGHARGDRPHADLGHQLDVDPGLVVGVLQVMDELGQILDGVDVVVGRRRDQPDARGRVPGAGDPRVDLVARELATFARLGPLGHLDLEVVGVDEVLARDAEAPGGDLFDGAAPQVAVRVGDVAVGVLSPLARVGTPPEAVHGDGQRLVGFPGDRTVRHGSRGEPLDDLGDGLDLLQGDGGPADGTRMSA